MERPNFFCNVEALNCILGMNFEGDYQDIDLTVDLIELPYMVIFTSDEENWTVKAMQRGEMYMHDESGIEAGHVVVQRKSGEGQVQATSELAENMGAFFQACLNISRFIQDNDLERVYADFDPEEEGIQLYVEAGELKYKVVSGKERPDMMVFGLFGTTGMGRPYMEDFWERSARDAMSLDEKIEAAENGDIELMDELAIYYLEECDEPDAEKAAYWFRKLAKAGVSNGMFSLALHYAKGFGVPRDFEQAVYWMEKAAENGDEDAPSLVEKLQKAIAAEKVVSSGDAQAQADLADFYMFLGNSLEQADPEGDYAIAVDYAQKSAAQGNGDGIWVLALAYEHGRGVVADRKRAAALYAQGAEIGHAPCQHSLGCYYIVGDILEEDHQKGFVLLLKAAQQGYGLAMRDVGHCYEHGDGVAEDMKAALAWYEKAAEVLDDPELAEKAFILRMIVENSN